MSGSAAINDAGQFQDIAGGAPAAMAAGTIFMIGADLGGFRHQQIQFALRKVIQLLEFHFAVEQMAAKPFAHLFLRGDVAGHGPLLPTCFIVQP